MKKVFCFMFGLLFLFGSVALAKDGAIETPELAIDISHITYEEPDVMKEKGLMYGLSGAAYAYQKDYFIKLEGRFALGQVDYSSTSTGTIDSIDDFIVEIRGLVGKKFPIFKATDLMPYFGFGYRYLNDDTSGMTSSTGHLGYERESNYFYSPIGIETLTELSKGWAFGARLEYDIFWNGTQKSHLSDAVVGFADLENDQDQGYGVRGSLKLIKKDEKLDFIIEPFMNYWNISQSDNASITYAGVIVGKGYEPKNNSTEVGVKIGVKF